MASISYLLAKRIHFSKGDETQRVSPPAIRIAIAGIAIGVAVMLLSVAIVVGFKEEVRQRVIDFSGHIHVQALTANQTYELPPLTMSDSLWNVLQTLPGITEARGVVTKPAVLKADSDFVSIVAKGVFLPTEADTVPSVPGVLAQTLDEREVAVSQTIADKLRLNVGDEVTAYFVQSDMAADPFAFGAENTKVKARRLTVASIYQTHFSEIDQDMVLTSVSLLQNVSGWDDNMFSSLELRIDDFDLLYERCYGFNERCLSDEEHVPLFAQTIEQINPQVFSWLELLDTNVWVILLLIAAVASFTMISGLLIIILERTQMIAILKAQGLDNGRLRKVFLWVAVFLTGKGMLWGNLIGISLCLIQWQWHVFSLDPETYYLEWVPIHLSPLLLILVNVGTILVTLLVLIAPTTLVAHISPTRTLNSE